VKKVGRVQVMADRIRDGRALPQNTVTKKASGQGISGSPAMIGTSSNFRSPFSAGEGRCAYGNHDAVPMWIMRPPNSGTGASSDDVCVLIRWFPFLIVFRASFLPSGLIVTPPCGVPRQPLARVATE
jgi:hypothetical protein